MLKEKGFSDQEITYILGVNQEASSANIFKKEYNQKVSKIVGFCREQDLILNIVIAIVLPLFFIFFYTYPDETYFIFSIASIACVLVIGLIICLIRHYQVFLKKH